MMEIEQLRRLINEANVQINVLAQLCHCAPTTIYNYARGTSIPNGTKLLNIREGLKKYKELINSIIME